jgi:threonine synthase
MPFNLRCGVCGQEYDPASLVWRCTCGGLLDLATFEAHFPFEAIQQRPPTLWRYREALPFAPDYTGWQQITMGEGFTPLIPLGAEAPGVLLKVEYQMPTLSFKDRGAAVLIAKAQELGIRRVIADSSGNAGTAIAAYAARAGIACDVYVPASASAKKLRQMAAHGATVHAIPGSREDTASAAIAAVEREQVFYASHVYQPVFFQGTKTYAFELFEQLGGSVPGMLVLPVGNGTLLLGAHYGFKDLLRAGLIQHMPRFLAVQAEGCAPLTRAFERSDFLAAPVINTGTEAEGIAIAAPARSRQILAAVRETGGVIISVPDTAILAARDDLARRGLYVEPTAAAPYAGFITYAEHFTLSGERVIIPLCGAGLKAG